MASLSFTVPGDPQALRRHRSARRGERIVQYDPKENVTAKARIQEAWSHAGHDTFPQGQPLAVTVYCHFKRPKSHFGTGRNSHSLKSSVRWHVSRPDGSNLNKLIEDSLNGLAWHDDSQIARSTLEKVYCAEDELPHTDVIVMELKQRA